MGTVLSVEVLPRGEVVSFDGLFSAFELRRALRFAWILQWVLTECRILCSKSRFFGSAPCSISLILSWGVKRSIVVPVFKRGDAGLATNYRPISLASCCFKLFEHLVHSRIGPFISSQLDVCQGGFRWSADVLVSSLLDVLSSRRSALTFVAFVDLQKAFDTAWF